MRVGAFARVVLPEATPNGRIPTVRLKKIVLRMNRLLTTADGTENLESTVLAEQLAEPAPHRWVAVDDDQADSSAHYHGTSTGARPAA
jgi:hypothetical protein